MKPKILATGYWCPMHKRAYTNACGMCKDERCVWIKENRLEESDGLYCNTPVIVVADRKRGKK